MSPAHQSFNHHDWEMASHHSMSPLSVRMYANYALASKHSLDQHSLQLVDTCIGQTTCSVCVCSTEERLAAAVVGT